MRWLDGEGGCLITHNRVFNGCEATTAILVTKTSNDTGVRSGLLRGVARLILVANEEDYSIIKLSQDFDVIDNDADS